MPIIELSTALVAAGSSLVVPFMNKVLEKSAQRLGGHVDENLAALFTRAHDHLAATGREAKSVEAKIAIPLLQAAALESDPALIEKWAALLANAADPAQRVAVQPGFTEVLRQLTPDDAQVLEYIYAEHPPQEDDIFCHYPTVEDTLFHFEWDALRLEFALDNLLRLRLFEFTEGGLYTADNSLGTKQRFIFNAFGSQFVLAVTPPTA